MESSCFAEAGAERAIRWVSIVGAPRCGTTSLARYLSAHPNVCLSNVKEPHFFSRRDLSTAQPEDIARVLRTNYVEHFFPKRAKGAILLDGSVSYLYAPERLEPVLGLWPDSKFIIAVRNPIEMLPSLHQRNICNGDEDVRDFETAWSLIGERRGGRRIPRGCVDARLLDYEEIGRLGRHVRHFIEVVGRERCFVSVFDDLVRDPSAQFRQILRFLALPDFRTEFVPHRASAGVRSAALQRLLKRPPQMARSLLASEADLHREGQLVEQRLNATPGGRLVKRMRKRLLGWNRTRPPSRALSLEIREAISAALVDDIEDLSNLLDRDLSHWLGTSRRVPVFTDRESSGVVEV